MKSKRLFSKIAQKTHMPFYSDGEIVFCTNDRVVKKQFGRKRGKNHDSEYRPWKLAVADWNTKAMRQIETGLPADAVLCNPMFYRDGETLHVSFIGGIPNDDALDTHMYVMQGNSWNSLSEPKLLFEEFVSTGYVSPRHICIGNAKYLTLTDKVQGKRFRLTTSLEGISRATFDPDRPGRILITGMDDYDRYCTLVYDVDTEELLEFTGPGQIYKACLLGNRIVFAYRESEDVEDYQLTVAPLVLEPTEKTVTVVEI